MDTRPSPTAYKNHRFPPEIISYAVWLYPRFCLSFRDVEGLLAERGVIVSDEAVRQWGLKCGQTFAKKLRHRRGQPGDTWYLDEAVITIGGERHYLLLKGLWYVPRKRVTDKLGSYRAARRELLPGVDHCHDKRANNRAEVSHQPTRQQERQMRRFKSPGHAQRFLSVPGPINNLLRVGRHLLSALHYRLFRDRAFAVWRELTGAQNMA